MVSLKYIMIKHLGLSFLSLIKHFLPQTTPSLIILFAYLYYYITYVKKQLTKYIFLLASKAIILFQNYNLSLLKVLIRFLSIKLWSTSEISLKKLLPSFSGEILKYLQLNH